MFKLNNITKTFLLKSRKVGALKGVNLEFDTKGLYYILGPSGNGKSTLLNLLGGIDSPTSGEMYINNKLTNDFTDEEWDNYRNHELGFVFQNFNLLQNLTILENVALKLESINSYSREDIRQKSIEVLNKVGLGDHLHKIPGQLSGGQQQRVAVARALVNNPSVILCDEPTAALDMKTSMEIMQILEDISKDTLVIIVTHSEKMTRKFPGESIHILNGKNTDIPEVNVDYVEKDVCKKQISSINTLKLSLKNIRTHLKRAIIVVVACSISVCTVLTTFSLSSGLSYQLVNEGEEKSVKYPVSVSSMSYFTENDYNSSSSIDDELYDFIEYRTQAIFYGINDDMSTITHNIYILPENHEDLGMQYNILAGTLDITDDELVVILDEYNQSTLLEQYYPNFPNQSNPENYVDQVIRRFSLDSRYVWSEQSQRMHSTSATTRYNNSESLRIATVLSPKDLYPENDIAIVSNILPQGIYMTYDKYMSIVQESSTSDFASYFNANSSRNILTGASYSSSHLREIHISQFSLEQRYYSISFVPSSVSNKTLLMDEIYEIFSANGYISDPVTETLEYTRSTTNSLLVVILVISLVAIFVAGILIFILTYANILKRKREIGVLRSIGLTKNKTIKVFVLETAIISVVASLLAILLLLLVQIPIESFAYDNFGYGDVVRITPINIIVVIFICNISFYVSSYFPVKKGVNIDIAKLGR